MSEDLSSDRQRWADLAEQVAGLGYWRRDVATQTMHWSPNMFRLYGFEPGPEPTLQDILDRVHPDDVAQARSWIQSLAAGTPGEQLARIVWPDGELRWVEVRGACEFSENGAVSAILGVVMDVTERQRSQAALAAQKTHLDLLAEHGGDIIFELNVDRTIRYVSNAIRRLGYEPDELIGRRPMEIIHPDDLPKVWAMVADYIAATPIDPLRDRSYRLMTADGGYVWMEGRPTPIYNAAGELTGAISVMHDVTERRAAAMALEESERRYRLIAAHTQDMIAVCDPTGLLTFMSPACRTVLGYEPEEMVGRNGNDFIHPDDVAKTNEAVLAYVAEGPGAPSPRLEYRGRHKDGRDIWLEANPHAVFDADGVLIQLQDNARDITERKRVDAALAKSEQLYRLLAESVTDIVSCSNMDGRMTYLSPSVRAVTGYAAEELVGLRMLETIHPDDVARATAYFEAAVRGDREEGQTLAYRTRHRSGEWMWLECNPTIVRDEAGEPLQFIDVTRDVSGRARLEAELRAARDAAEAAAAVKSDFMANMSHEIRTPLTAVIGFSSLISGRTDLDATAREHAERIAAAGRALLALVNDVLDFSKLEAGRMELSPKPVAPATVAREALDLFSLQAEAKGLELVFDPAPDLPACVSLDPKAVGQVLLNLLGNAVKFSPAGQVALRLAYEPQAQVLKVRVRDTGPGLSEDQRQRLFQRFSQVDASSTRRHGGTGLGLAICKGLVEAMGGEIGVDSVVGEGSTFHFAIPADG